MQYFYAKAKKTQYRGFTLVELLVVVVVLAVLAAIVLPKFVNSSQRSKEASLKQNLKMLRDAINRFYTDTGYYPHTLDDLAKTNPSDVRGADPSGSGGSVVIDANTWHGPYIDEVPLDPISGDEFLYKNAGYGIGRVKSNAMGTALDGSSYMNW